MNLALVKQTPSVFPKRLRRRRRQSGHIRRVTALKHQAAMIKAKKKFMLLIAGYGSGKSHALHLCVATDVMQFPGIKVLVLAPSYDLLRLNNVPALEELFSEWGLKYTFNKSEFIMHLPNGSQVILRSMDNPSRIVAFEVCRTYIDEADVPPLTQMEMAWNKALGRTRQVLLVNKKVVSNRVWAFSTPEGYKFCYKRWVKLGGKEYGLVRARTMDNPFLPPDFVQSLRDTYPKQLIEAYLNGEFVNLTSGAVYYAFDRTTCDSDVIEKPKELMYIGMDFNVRKQAGVAYVKRGNAYHAVWEFKDLLDTPESIKIIKARFEGHPISVYPDATGKSKHTTDASKSDHSLLKKAGFLVKSRSRNPLVKDRVAAMNGAFEHQMLFVNVTRCPEYAESLEQQAFDVNGRPDKTTGHDHINDGGGYPIVFLMPIVDRKAYLSVVAI